MSDTVIQLRNLTKYYGKQRGIEDVSFCVKQGEIFGFIGPNGAVHHDPGMLFTEAVLFAVGLFMAALAPSYRRAVQIGAMVLLVFYGVFI